MNFKLRHTRGRLHSANYTFNNEVGSHRDMILSRLAAIGSFYLRLSNRKRYGVVVATPRRYRLV